MSVKLSIMMFLQYAVWGAWLPILYPFLLNHRGFTLQETGWCLSAGAVGAIFGPFISGQLADRSFDSGKLLAASHLIGAVLVFLLATIETVAPFVIVSALYGFVYTPTIALTNSVALANIKDRDRDFGPIRLWGTIGWIAAGILVGQYLLRVATPSSGTEAEISAALNAGRAVAFQMSAILGLVMGVFCFALPKTPPSMKEGEETAWIAALREIRVQPLLTLFLIAVPVSMIHQFYFVFTSEFLTGIQTQAASAGADRFADKVNQVLGVGGGGLMTIGQMSEIAVLALMPLLAKTFQRKWLLAIGLIAYAGRMALFAFAPSLLPVLAGVALHGICFGCFIFVAFMVVDENTSSSVRATAQNLFNLVIVGIGIIVGSLFATWVAEGASTAGELDYQQLFSVPMWMALGCLIALLLFYPNSSKEPVH